ncbi:receptor homology region, transmembrane domain- and RING domain-containing protein 2 [Rutidosis leptorrhynchoides]|uniref:receptor homology region, transmembrane domain- and RING domain-containing protein 2 n=1 Tax=Rutidosis leptorrhynchoides TaxID=125765 RepID=UPI003A98E669
MEHAYNANYSPFVLIVDGGCRYVDKVRRAQDAGFMAAIIYNPHDNILFPMTGDSNGIHIPAVTVSSRSGLKLLKYVGQNNIEVWLTYSDAMSTWFFMALVALVVYILLQSIAYCVEQMRHRSPQGSRVRRRFRGMRSRLVNAMPSITFTETLEDNCTSATCTICLEDYNVGDKIRILPCHHKFHTSCVDAWLKSWKAFCPVCKRDLNKRVSEPLTTEHTPLLSSSTTKNHQLN